jgi:hypothetical protein
MATLDMGGKFEGYDVVLLGRVGEKEVYSLSPSAGGDGVWITIERSAGDVVLQEIIDGSRMVSAHTAWLKYLMERMKEEVVDEPKFGFGTALDSDGGDSGV